MALALNIFKTITAVASTNPVGIYTAPVGYSGVVLLAQTANTSANSNTITFSHRRTLAGIAVTTELLKDVPIQGNDSLTMVQGRLILQSQDSLILSASSGNTLKATISILETLN